MEGSKDLKDQDVIMDTTYTRIGSTKTRITQFMRKSAFDPKYKTQYEQVHRIESRIRREMLQQIKEKQKPLECDTHSIDTIFDTSKILRGMKKPSPQKVVKSVEQMLLEEIQFPFPGDAEILGTGLSTYRTLKRLCKSAPVHINVPDTLIFGFGFKQPTIMYTDEHGVLQWKKGIEHFQFKKVLAIFKHLNERQKKHASVSPLFVFKTDPYRRIVLRRAEALEEWRSREKQPTECQMQRFLMPKGRMTCKLRVISVPQGFKAVMLTNRLRIDGKRDAEDALTRDQSRTRQGESSPKSEPEEDILPKGSDIHVQANHFKRVIEKRLAESVSRLTTTPMRPKPRPKSTTVQKFAFDHDDSDLRPYFQSDSAPVNLPPLPISQLYALLESEPKKEIEEVETDTKPLPSHLAPILRERFCIDSTDYKKTSACNIKSGKLIRPALLQTKLIRDLVDKGVLQVRNLKLGTIVCDFCEDREGVWWLLKIKAFSVEEIPAPPTRIRFKPLFKCPGDYCKVAVPWDEHYSFIGRDSVKFLYNGEMSDLHTKHTNVLYELSKKTMLMDKILKSGDTAELGDLLNPRLLERVRVCYNCFHIYKDKERAFFNAELSLLKRSRKERWEKNKTMKLLADVNDMNNISGKPDALLKPRIYTAHSQTLLLLERRIPDTSQHMREMGKQVTSMLKEEREKSKSYFTLHQPAPAPLRKVLPAVTSENSFKTKFKELTRFSDPEMEESLRSNEMSEEFEEL